MRIKLRWTGMFVAALLTAVFFLRAGFFLASPAGEPRRADVIVILGGDTGDRIYCGLDLYKNKFAPAILLIAPEAIEPFKRYRERQAQILIAGGTRKEAIYFDTLSANSWQEAENTLKLANARGWRRLIVISDPTHMRRLKWVWGKKFRGTGMEIILVEGRPVWWSAETWWANGRSAGFVISEYIKLAYYILKY